MALSACVVVAGLGSAIGARLTMALFDNAESTDSTVGTQRIFSGERVTTAFDVTDVSGGVPVDRSNPVAFVGDGRTMSTAAWSTTFSAAGYLDLDLNAPLPVALALSSAAFALSWSTDAGSTACFYFETRSITSGSVTGTYGSAGSPVGCVTGATVLTTTTLIALGDSDAANDLRVRVFATDSAAGSVSIDAATVTGDAGTIAFELYPVRMVDAADTTPMTTVWSLNGT